MAQSEPCLYPAFFPEKWTKMAHRQTVSLPILDKAAHVQD